MTWNIHPVYKNRAHTKEANPQKTCGFCTVLKFCFALFYNKCLKCSTMLLPFLIFPSRTTSSTKKKKKAASCKDWVCATSEPGTCWKVLWILDHNLEIPVLGSPLWATDTELGQSIRLSAEVQLSYTWRKLANVIDFILNLKTCSQLYFHHCFSLVSKKQH